MKPFVTAQLTLCATILLASSLPRPLAAAPDDEHWDPQFGWPGPGGNNYAITTHNGRIYASGLASSTNVALQVWNGAQWSPLSQFYGPVTTAIYDLAFVGDTLYAAGIFTNIDGLTITNLARWDGTSWSSVGFNKGTPYSLAVDGANLYVGGGFTNIGGVTMKNVGRWDGSSWHALGLGVGSTNLSLVYAVAVTNGTVYAGGFFTNAGAALANDVAHWDGANWSAMSTGISSIVTSLAIKGTEVYAVGSSSGTAMEKWDGTNWSICGGAFNSGAQSVAVFGNLVCAGGSFTTVGGTSASRFALWNGTSWAAAGLGVSAPANRVYSTGTNVYVGGNFLLAGGLIANGLASWDGANWNAIGPPGRINGISSTVSALAGDGTNLYAGGPFTAAGSTLANYVGRFDGTNWYPLGTGVGGVSAPTINAFALTNNYVYAGGSFTLAGGGLAANAALWDGSSWQALGGGPGGVVAALSLQPDGLYAAGASYNSSVYSSPFFSRWDGANWNSVLSFDPNDTFFVEYLNDSVFGMDAMAFIGSDIYVGGHFVITWHDPSLTQFIACSNILRFDGTYGRIVGNGLNSNVVAMAALGTDLYVAGPFTSASGVAANHIARWDGSSWWDVAGGVVGKGLVLALASFGGNLYAAGSFTNMGGVPANRIAVWDGANWSSFGSGTSGTVSSLGFSGNDLYVGGSFRAAGGKPSLFIGHWNDQINFNTPQLLNPAWLAGNQFRTRLFGVAGVTNIIQATTDFDSWTPVLTNSAGIYDFIDSAAPNYPLRFYRAMLAQ